MKSGVFIWAVAGLAASAAVADAASPKLKGEYAFTGSAACLVSGTPFNPDLTPTSFTISTSFSVMGIRTFDGNGNGTIKATSVSITPPPVNISGAPGPGPLGGIHANAVDFTAKFTYAVDGDGGVTTELVPGTYLATVTAGPNTGSTFTIDKLSLAGLISNNGQAITLASIVPVMETQTITPPSAPPFVRYRICHRSRSLIWMGN